MRAMVLPLRAWRLKRRVLGDTPPEVRSFLVVQPASDDSTGVGSRALLLSRLRTATVANSREASVRAMVLPLRAWRLRRRVLGDTPPEVRSFLVVQPASDVSTGVGSRALLLSRLRTATAVNSREASVRAMVLPLRAWRLRRQVLGDTRPEVRSFLVVQPASDVSTGVGSRAWLLSRLRTATKKELT